MQGSGRVRLQHDVNEWAAREVLSLKPLVEDVEHRDETTLWRVPTPVDLLFEPAASPHRRPPIEKRDRKSNLGIEMLVKTCLSATGLRKNGVDADLTHPMGAKEPVRRVDQSLTRGTICQFGLSRSHVITPSRNLTGICAAPRSVAPFVWSSW